MHAQHGAKDTARTLGNVRCHYYYQQRQYRTLSSRALGDVLSLSLREGGSHIWRLGGPTVATHRGVDRELVALRGLVVQLLDHGDDATGAVDGKELGGGLKGVEDAASCAQVGVGGVHNEDGRPHWCVLR